MATELVAMEDERDAALLEVERLKLEILALEHTVHHLLEQRDNAILRAERMEEERDDALLDVEGRGYELADALVRDAKVEAAAMRPVVDAAVKASKLRISRDLRRAVAEYLRRLEFDP